MDDSCAVARRRASALAHGAMKLRSLCLAAALRRCRGAGARRSSLPAAAGRRSTAARCARRWRARHPHRRQGQGPGDRRLRLHARPPPLGRIPRAPEPRAARRIERDARRSAASRSCWPRAATGRGAAGRRRSRRSSPRRATRRRCGSRRATRAAGASSIPMCSTARRPRSTPRRRAARFAALAKSS